MADCTALRIEEMEHAFGGAFVRARASLGVMGFGMQVIQLPPQSGEMAPEHDHLHDGQEEVYLLLDGSCEIDVAGERIDLGCGTFVRVGPGERRRLRSGTRSARVLAIGACPGRAYSPPPNSELGGPEILAPTASTSMSG
ncbi:MAG: cupin domain-containing protein [Solirubrobacteraceae bacterium]